MTKEEFRDWRKRLRLTQAEAASRLGKGKRQITAYECGSAPIPTAVHLATETIERQNNA